MFIVVCLQVSVCLFVFVGVCVYRCVYVSYLSVCESVSVCTPVSQQTCKVHCDSIIIRKAYPARVIAPFQGRDSRPRVILWRGADSPLSPTAGRSSSGNLAHMLPLCEQRHYAKSLNTFSLTARHSPQPHN